MPWTTQILILSVENCSLGPLKTFWPQGWKSVNRIFREIKKIFENLTQFWRYFRNPRFSMSPKMCWWRLTPAIKIFWPKSSLYIHILKNHEKIPWHQIDAQKLLGEKGPFPPPSVSIADFKKIEVAWLNNSFPIGEYYFLKFKSFSHNPNKKHEKNLKP